MDNYTIEAVLGKGSYGKIYKARRKSDGLICVLKLIGLEGLDEDERNDTLNEVLFTILLTLNFNCGANEFIIKLVQSYATNRPPKHS